MTSTFSVCICADDASPSLQVGSTLRVVRIQDDSTLILQKIDERKGETEATEPVPLPRKIQRRKLSLPPRLLDETREETFRLFDAIESDVVKETDRNEEDEEKPEEEDEDDLMLSCTLCQQKISIDELEVHSRVCSAQPRTKGSSLSSGGDQLCLSVTVSRLPATSIKNPTYKIVTKNDDLTFCCDSVRSYDDAVWLRSALTFECPECLIPPIASHSLDAAVSAQILELQRFMTKVVSHNILKRNETFEKFLIYSASEFETFRLEIDIRHKLRASPLRVRSSLLQNREIAFTQCEKYLLTIKGSLRGLSKSFHAKFQDNKFYENWFKSLSNSEPKGTYLETACHAMARLCKDIEKQRDDVEDYFLSRDVDWLIRYVESAEELLERTQEAVDRFLYWDEEVKSFEMSFSERPPLEPPPSPPPPPPPPPPPVALSHCDSSSSLESSNSCMSPPTSTTPVRGPLSSSQSTSSVASLRWAEANAAYEKAKEDINRIRSNLVTELFDFDLKKETELKKILLAFTDMKIESSDKVRNKWVAGRMLLDTPIQEEIRALNILQLLDAR